ncbi:MAG: PAS domain-containing protein [Pseudomonadota bacterium]
MSDRRVGRIADAAVAGQNEPLAQLFHAEGAPAPRVVWKPAPEDLGHPVLTAFFERCQDLPATAGGVAWDDLRLENFDDLSQWIMVLRCDPRLQTFRYIQYGASLAEHLGDDMTGQTTGAFGGHIGVFFSGIYEAARRRRQWLFTEHQPPRRIFVKSWKRLIVPLMEAGDATGFVVANVAENELRAGLEVLSDPVVVLREDRTLCYVNSAARKHLGVPAMGYMGRSLPEVAGFEIETQETASDLIVHKQVVSQTVPGDRGNDVVVAISGAIVRDLPYYVLQFRVPPPETA